MVSALLVCVTAHTLLSSSPLAWSVTSPEQQTKADELDNPALFMKISKQKRGLVSFVE